jgi:putative tryptophan/tyrosine transport system substrate-binding protein
MRRRKFIAGLGGAAAGWPLAVRAQRSDLPVIVYFSANSQNDRLYLTDAFRHGLREAGYVEGRSVVIEYHWAENKNERLPALAAEIIRRQPAVIFAEPGTAALAAKAATTTIPIVFTSGVDPVNYGLVASLNRPGGNLTGASVLSVELTTKRLEVLHQLVPTATTIAFLINPTNPFFPSFNRDGTPTATLQAAAHSLGLGLVVLQASSERDFDAVFTSFSRLRTGALLTNNDPLFNTRSEQFAALTVRHSVPSIFPNREFAAAGGLASYGGAYTDSWRLAGVYVGRILKGEKPADLPVQQVTKIEMVINLKTAKALGLTIPETLLATADEVIQ